MYGVWVWVSIHSDVAPKNGHALSWSNSQVTAFWKVGAPPLVHFKVIKIDKNSDQTAFQDNMLLWQEDRIVIEQVAQVVMDSEELPRKVPYQLQPLNLMDPAT
jgi:hypothetical protein